MRRGELGDLAAFLAVAEERSFSRAAAKLGTSQSALSHTVRRLESRLGLRLLTRTTRNVATTDAGERLIETLRPALAEIDGKLTALSELREKPAGMIRITAGEHAAEQVLLPALARLLPHYPDITVEVSVDLSLTDIVAERFDAGVRLGEQVAKDMIAVPLGPDMRMAVVGSPAYFAKHPAPKTPQQLAEHRCINLRLPTRGGLYAWEFEKAGRALNVRVEGQLVCTRPPRSAGPRWRDGAWPVCWKTMSRPRSSTAGWCACWATGARPSPAITFTIPAAASNRRPSRSWWRRCVIVQARQSAAPAAVREKIRGGTGDQEMSLPEIALPLLKGAKRLASPHGGKARLHNRFAPPSGVNGVKFLAAKAASVAACREIWPCSATTRSVASTSPIWAAMPYQVSACF